MKTFSRVLQTSKPPDTVRTEALTSLTEPLARYDYVLTTESESGLTFARQYRPWWVWVLAVAIFPSRWSLNPMRAGPSSALRASANGRSGRLSSPWSCSHRLSQPLASRRSPGRHSQGWRQGRWGCRQRLGAPSSAHSMCRGSPTGKNPRISREEPSGGFLNLRIASSTLPSWCGILRGDVTNGPARSEEGR